MKIGKIIIPSIIAKTQKELDERIEKVKGFAKVIQLDVMDGKFVDNHSLDFDFKLHPMKCKVEVHLMIKHPFEWLNLNYKKADRFIISIESCDHPEKIIEFLRVLGKGVGFSVDPETPLVMVEDYLPFIDQITIMTVEPGKYGATFIPKAIEKVKKLRMMTKKIDIEVDGGISPENTYDACQAGANRLVSGSYIQNAKSPEKAYKHLVNETKFKLFQKWKK